MAKLGKILALGAVGAGAWLLWRYLARFTAEGVVGNTHGQIGDAMQVDLTAKGGSSAPAWSLASGRLPGGLSLSHGIISGIPLESGTFRMTFAVRDQLGNTAQIPVRLDIDPAPLWPGPVAAAGLKVMLNAHDGKGFYGPYWIWGLTGPSNNRPNGDVDYYLSTSQGGPLATHAYGSNIYRADATYPEAA